MPLVKMKKVFLGLSILIIILAVYKNTAALIVVPPGPVIGSTGLLQTGTVSQLYSQTIQVSSGISPYTWTITAGNLPPGLTLGISTGIIFGVPTTTSTFNFTVQVTDGNFETASQNFTLVVAPQSTTGFVYSRTPTGSVVISPLTIRIQGIFGVDFCTDPRSNSYLIRFGGFGPGGATNSQIIDHVQGDVVDDTFQVNLAPNTYTGITLQCNSGTTGITFLESGAVDVPTIIIPTSNLANGFVQVAYSQTVQAIGGITPLTWSIINGFLPTGLSLNSSTGEIFGIPTVVEVTSFTVQVVDANNKIATKDLSIIIHGNTPIGSNVLVGPLNNVALIFSQVIQEGHTTAASSSSGPTPPSGFKLGNPPTYYSISTTAQFNPPVEVCVTYDDTQFKNEKNLKLFHFESGQRVNVTTFLDTTSNVVCGSVSSFSEFGLFEEITVDHIIDEVQGFDLDPDIEQGLLDKLNAAKSAIERNQNKTARNILKAFINLVNAQEGKKITNDQANILRADAHALINSLGSNLLSTIFKWVMFGWLDKFINAMVGSKL